jgi:hypothetical protein
MRTVQTKPFPALVVLTAARRPVWCAASTCGRIATWHAVNSNPEFAAFNDAILPLLAQPAKRMELSLLHLFART